MSAYTVDFPDVRAASAAMVDSAEAMASELALLSSSVGELQGGRWRGAAATSFAAEWEAWRLAAGRVIDGLAGLGVTLSSGGSAYVSTEADVTRAAS